MQEYDSSGDSKLLSQSYQCSNQYEDCERSNPRISDRNRDYSTFKDFSCNAKSIRNHSVSLPYIPHAHHSTVGPASSLRSIASLEKVSSNRNDHNENNNGLLEESANVLPSEGVGC